MEAAGEPDVYLTLIDPAKDRTLQQLLKAGRVMSLHQPRSGADHGTIGLDQEMKGQVLTFPRPINAFAGRRVIGINYEILQAKPTEHAKKSVPHAVSSRAAGSANSSVKPQRSHSHEETTAAAKVIPFPRPERPVAEITDWKKRVRHAVRLIEQGKPGAARNLLRAVLE